jgi:hypothetical protein
LQQKFSFAIKMCTKREFVKSHLIDRLAHDVAVVLPVVVVVDVVVVAEAEAGRLDEAPAAAEQIASAGFDKA